MKLVFTDEDGKEHVFDEITDCYIAIRQFKPIINKKKNFTYMPETQSYSWGSNLREIVKELTQSLVELQKILNERNK